MFFFLSEVGKLENAGLRHSLLTCLYKFVFKMLVLGVFTNSLHFSSKLKRSFAMRLGPVIVTPYLKFVSVFDLLTTQ